MPEEETHTEPTIQELRAAADEGRVARREADELKRQLAFTRAGIDYDSGVGKLLFGSFDGEPNPEAVLAAAKEYGIEPKGSEAPPPPSPATDPNAQAAQAAQAALSADNAPPETTTDIPTVDQAYEQYRGELGKGKQNRNAAAKVIDRQIAAAMSGDEKAVWKGYWTPEELQR